MRGGGGGRGYMRMTAGLGEAPSTDNSAPKPLTALTLPRFLRIVKPYFLPSGVRERVAAASCFLFLGLSKACNLAAPSFLGVATDALVHKDLPAAIRAILAFGVLRVAVSAFEEAQRLVYLRVKEVAYHELACSTFEHLHKLSLNWHVSKQSGVVLRAMDRGISSASTVVDLLFLRLGPTIAEMVVIVVLFLVFYGNLSAGAVLVLSFVAYVTVTVCLTRRRVKIRQSMHAADNQATQVAVDAMTGFETVKSFSNERFELGRYSDAILRFQKATRESQSTLVFVNLSQAAVMRAAFVGVMLVSAVSVASGSASLGEFVAFQTYVTNLFAPLTWLGSMYQMVSNAFTDMTNLGDLLAEEPDLADAPGAQPLQLLPGSQTRGPEVRFEAVAFSYGAEREGRIEARTRAQLAEGAGPSALGKSSSDIARGSAKATTAHVVINVGSNRADAAAGTSAESAQAPPRVILRDVSFTIAPGTTTAVCGQTGAGKSTLARLLFRFYDVSGGRITIDGQDVRSVTMHSLRSSIGMVPQDCVLFNDTLRYNIAYGRPGASDAEVEAAAAAAQLSDFLRRLPEGLDTKVGERGLRLSGGERQRVAIARVLLRNPPILVLDEATASLDVGTEAAIQAALTTVRAGRTVLLIAHRLSTVRDAQQIIVLSDGCIAERGTHEELLSIPGGVYRGMWQRQLVDAASVDAGGSSGGGALPAPQSASPPATQ